MSKAIINNEVIILRKFVEQARVHTIKKLTRDVTKYRNKKGTEAQKAKNERKSQRLAAEILSIKKVKKDEITKHILTNNLKLKEVLENQTSLPLNRAMARIAHHKIFCKKIAEFKSKYPNYMEFMGPSRRKRAICEWKEKKKIYNKERVEKIVETKKDNEELESKSVSEASDYATKDKEINDEKNDNEDFSEKKIEMDEKCNESSNESSNIIKMKKLEKLKETDLQNNSSAKLDERKKDVAKIISKEAIVTKLTDILQKDTYNKDYEEEVNSESSNSNVVLTKEVDSFFMTGDERSYLSIAVPKDKTFTVEEDFNGNKERNYKKSKFPRQQNDKFFSKVVKLKNDLKFMSRWEDTKLGKEENSINRSKLEKKRKLESTSSRNDGEKARFVKNDYKSVEQLHPSWEAKKKEQEMLKKGFQGKKIIFADDT